MFLTTGFSKVKSFFFSSWIIPAFDSSESCTFQTICNFSTIVRLAPGPRPEQHNILSLFCQFIFFFLLTSNLFSCYISFWTPKLLVVTLPSDIPPTHFIWNFHRLLFTLRSTCTLCNLRGQSKIKNLT